MNRKPLHLQRSHITPIAVAVALALPGAAALAQPMSDVVTTRADQTVTQQYGRDSAYAFSTDTKPLTPAQTGSSKAVNEIKAYSANAWDKTKAFLAAKPGRANPNDPQRYGRAGGYVGADEIAFMHSDLVPTTPAAADTVKSGSAEIDRDRAAVGSPADTSTPSTPPEQHTGRTGDRFDNPEGTRGQNENGG